MKCDFSRSTIYSSDLKTVKTYNMTAGEINIPIAVLVSAQTASAAEVFVCDMRQMNKCTVYGDESTKGQCLVQDIFELSDEGALLLSVGMIYPYSGESYEDNGIEPDDVYEYEEKNDDFSKDSLFLYAASILVG